MLTGDGLQKSIIDANLCQILTRRNEPKLTTRGFLLRLQGSRQHTEMLSGDMAVIGVQDKSF